MPNHIQNELIASKSVIDSLIAFDEESKSCVDFNTVIPIPEILKGDSASPEIEKWANIALGNINLSTLSEPRPENMAELLEKGDFGTAAKFLEQASCIKMMQSGPFPKDFEQDRFETFIKYIRAIKETGYANWYGWSCEKWGTKWNAYDTNRISDNKVQFQTAWSAPFPVLEALSKKFPEESVELRWADEDFGNNAGDIMVLNGNVIEGRRYENGSDEAKELALELHYDGELPDYLCRDENGKIVSNEKEEEVLEDNE